VTSMPCISLVHVFEALAACPVESAIHAFHVSSLPSRIGATTNAMSSSCRLIELLSTFSVVGAGVKASPLRTGGRNDCKFE